MGSNSRKRSSLLARPSGNGQDQGVGAEEAPVQHQQRQSWTSMIPAREPSETRIAVRTSIVGATNTSSMRESDKAAKGRAKQERANAKMDSKYNPEQAKKEEQKAQVQGQQLETIKGRARRASTLRSSQRGCLPETTLHKEPSQLVATTSREAQLEKSKQTSSAVGVGAIPVITSASEEAEEAKKSTGLSLSDSSSRERLRMHEQKVQAARERLQPTHGRGGGHTKANDAHWSHKRRARDRPPAPRPITAAANDITPPAVRGQRHSRMRPAEFDLERNDFLVEAHLVSDLEPDIHIGWIDDGEGGIGINAKVDTIPQAKIVPASYFSSSLSKVLFICVLVLFLAGVVFAGVVCGTGNCTAKSLEEEDLLGQSVVVFNQTYHTKVTTDIDLSNSQLTGPIPSELGLLTELTKLSLGGNMLTGNMPLEVATVLTSLTVLDLNENLISGTIPPELAMLTNLVHLDLEDNKLSGSIPAVFGTMSHIIETLSLVGNPSTGTVPSELGLLTTLKKLTLSGMEGTIPQEVLQLTGLEYLALEDTFLTGPIPTEIGLMDGLTVLALDTNEFTGTLPTQLWKLTSLEEMDFENNHLIGTLPTQLGLFTSLQKLDLEENSFSGPIPSEIGQVEALEELKLGQNKLTGTVPSTIFALPMLMELKLEDNLLTET